MTAITAPWAARHQRWPLVAPALLVLGIFGVALADLLAWSFYSSGKIGVAPTGSTGLQTYRQILSDPLYLGAILATFRLSAIATVASLVLGLPVAYWIVRT